MSKTLLTLFCLIIFISIIAISNDLMGNLSGPPAGNTGSPADGKSCTSCHSGTAINISGWITSNIPAEGYVGGKTYTITATATLTNCVRFGFEISPQKTNGTQVGTLVVTDGTQTQIISKKYIGHRTAGTTGSTTKTWTFNWTAPAAGTGSFTFYGAFNCSNNNGSSSGDKIFLSTLPVNECSYTPQITSNSGSLNSCNGQSLQLTVADASTFQWSNSATTSQISAASSGSYGVTATDVNGCPGNNSTTVNISNISLSEIHSDATCGNSNGSITLTPTGGITPYTYHWSNGATSQGLASLTGGTSYTVTVTDGINCSKTLSVAINQGTTPTTTATPINTTCGNINGGVTLSVSGGSTPYTYSWSNSATTQNLLNVGAGTYLVTVTDAKSCTKTATASVASSSGVSVTKSNVNATCGNPNGSIALSPSGGVTPYTYSWNNNATTQNLQNINSGTYIVSVTDAAGCSASSTSVINQLSAPTVTANGKNATCGLSNGSVSLSVSGNAPFNFKWSNTATTQNINLLNANSYTVTVTDVNSCTALSSTNISQLPAPTATNTTTAATCGQLNGSVTLSVSGGTSPFTYQWTNSGTTANLANISGGSYSVVITDANGCTAGSSASVTGTFPPSLSETHINPACGINNGSVTITVVNGVSPFTYLWNTSATTNSISNISSGTYTCTVTDSNACSSVIPVIVNNLGGPSATETHVNETCSKSNGSINLTVTGGKTPYDYVWNTGQTTQDLDSITAGRHTVIITDSNLCVFSLNAILTNSSPPVLTSHVLNATCGVSNGAVVLTVTGGTDPFIYSWSSGQTSKDIISLSAQDYTVTVIDSNKCVSSLTSTVSSISAAAITPVKTNTTCGGNNGAIVISVNGGTSPYTYQWNSGQTTANIDSLIAGTYNLVFTDSNNCSASIFVTIDSSSSPLITPTHTDEACGKSNATINLTVSGGVAPYTYNWRSGQTTQDISGLTNGSYFVTVTDSNSCFASLNINVATIPPPVISSVTTNTTCGQSNGSVAITTSDGITPYTYSWSSGQTTQDVNNLPAGDYSVTASDANGCTAVAFDTILPSIGAPKPTIAVNNGVISVVNSKAYTSFVWVDNGDTLTNETNSSYAVFITGSYSVIATDSAGCSVQSTPKTVITGIDNVNVGNDIKIYPNPATDILLFEGTTNMKYIRIYSTVGKMVIEADVKLNSDKTLIDISSLPAGVYMAEITSPNGVSAIRKFVKM